MQQPPSSGSAIEPQGLRPRFVEAAPPRGKRLVSAWTLLIWLPGAVAVAAAVGWTGQAVQSGVTVGDCQVRFAPWLLFPLLLGAVLGGALFALMRVLQLGHWPSVLGGTLPAVIVAVMVQHLAAWYEWRAERWQHAHSHPQAAQLAAAGQALQEQRGEQLAPFEENLLAYLQHEAARGRPLTAFWTARGVWTYASWTLDAVLTAGAGLAMVLSALGQPYCAQCRSWYRTVRRGGGKAPPPGQLLQLLFEQPRPGACTANYRLQECLGGCGPTRLTLTATWPNEASESGDWWLGTESRQHVAAALEQARLGPMSLDHGRPVAIAENQRPSPDRSLLEP